ncbi:MAG: XRE family transcriptional regulator [Lactobacillus sp.]|nr:MAG: XRE family transcriptional regulator [Lactobacillus sp.]
MFELIGKIIHQHRIAQGLTIAELAEAAGVSDSYISRLELGTAKDSHVLKLEGVAEALGLNIKDLFDEPEVDPYTVELINKLTALSDTKRKNVSEMVLKLIDLLENED